MQNSFDRWPAVYRACISTFFSAEKFARPGEVPANGNYILAALARYEQSWRALHEHRGIPHAILDAAAAHEIIYQHNRGVKPLRPQAWISACICNLVTDRPEFVIDRHARAVARAEHRIGRKAGAVPQQ